MTTMKRVPAGKPPHVVAWAESTPVLHTPRGQLLTFCWCKTFQVFVPEREIWAGRTLSCGEPECHEPDIESLLGIA